MTRLVQRLDALDGRSLAHIDENGNVGMLPWRRRASWRLMKSAGWGLPMGGALACCIAGVSAVPLLVAGIGFGVWLQLRAGVWVELQRVASEAAAGHIDHARQRAQSVLGSSLSTRRQRAVAARTLATLAFRFGRPEDVLVHSEEARQLRRDDEDPARWELLAVQEAIALITLDRLDEARARLASLSLDGDLVRLSRWTGELYLALAERKHTLDGAALEARAQFAQSVPIGSALLALVSWAYEQRGEVARAKELFELAYARATERKLFAGMPRLHQWMREHAAWVTPDARL